jgi:hypothetical protein
LINLEKRVHKIDKLLPTLSEGNYKEGVIQEKKKLEPQITILKNSIELLENEFEIRTLREEYKSLIEKKRRGEYVEDLAAQKLYEIQKLTEKNKKIKNIGIELSMKLIGSIKKNNERFEKDYRGTESNLPAVEHDDLRKKILLRRKIRNELEKQFSPRNKKKKRKRVVE